MRARARRWAQRLMEGSLQPRYFGPAERRLFGVYHPAVGQLRATVLLCPPLLHEQVRSYRFFSQMAVQLTGAGLACLRFDYYGTGDSEGEDDAFLPANTRQDLELAAAELRRCAGDAPMILMAARGSALLAHRDAAAVGACALWLWQPVADGGRYLQSLQARDRAERSSRYRYPLLRREARSGPHDLMGFALSPDFPEQLAALRIGDAPAGVKVAVLDVAGAAEMPAEMRGPLPLAVSAWVDEIDLDGLIPLREARAGLEALVSDIPRWTAHG